MTYFVCNREAVRCILNNEPKKLSLRTQGIEKPNSHVNLIPNGTQGNEIGLTNKKIQAKNTKPRSKNM